jgi:hypothetical protein
VVTLLGTSDIESKQTGSERPTLVFDEPGGLSVAGDRLYIADTNHHAIRVLDLTTNELKDVVIEGLAPPKSKIRAEELKLPQAAKRMKVAVQKIRSDLKTTRVKVMFEIEDGWKLNPLADFPVVVLQPGFANMNMRTSVKVDQGAIEFELPLPDAEEQVLQIAVGYYYCQSDEQGLCLADNVILDVPVQRDANASQEGLDLKVAIEP